MTAILSCSVPAIATSCMSGAQAARIAWRRAPTLTRVPVVSLKSSARRPSKQSPCSGASLCRARARSPVRRGILRRRAKSPQGHPIRHSPATRSVPGTEPPSRRQPAPGADCDRAMAGRFRRCVPPVHARGHMVDPASVAPYPDMDQRRTARAMGACGNRVLQPLPSLRSHAGTRKEDQVQAFEQCRTGERIGGQMIKQQIDAIGHVNMDRRADGANAGRQRIHIIRPGRQLDMIGAAVPDHFVEIVEPAEDMVPGQPVDERRPAGGEKRPVDAVCALAGRNHAPGDRNSLGVAGGSGCEID